MSGPELVGKHEDEQLEPNSRVGDAEDTRQAKIDEFQQRHGADDDAVPPPTIEAFAAEPEPPPGEPPPGTPSGNLAIDRSLTAVTALAAPGELADDNPFDDEEEVHNYQFAEWLKEDRAHAANCKTLPLTFITWFVFLLVMYFSGSIENSFRMRECLKLAVEEVRAPHSVVGYGQSRQKIVKLHEIASVEEMWSWIDLGFVPAMHGSPLKPGFVRTFNQVIGEVQLRQTRLKPGDCNVGDDLTKYYRQSCHGSGVSTVGGDFSTTPYGMSSVDASFMAGYGMGSKMSAFNRKRFFAWLDVRMPTLGQSRVRALRTNRWLDSGTNKLEILVGFFNAEVETYAHMAVTFILERDGLVYQDLEVHSLWTSTSYPWYYWLFNILWMVCVLKFIANSVQLLIDSKERNAIVRCCGDFWQFLDWLSIILALLLIIFGFLFASDYDELAKSVGGLGNAPGLPASNATVAQIHAYAAGLDTYYANISEILEDIEHDVMLKLMYRLGQYWYAMILLLRFFKGFRGQPRIKQVTSTISSAAADLWHFGLIFLVIFVNFGIAGHVLFGSEVNAWSTPEKAVQSSLALAYGRVDWEPLQRIAPISAVIWLFGYAVAIVLLLLNMVLGIIADHYGGVYHKINDKGYGIIGQTQVTIMDMWWDFSYIVRWIYRILYDMFPSRVKTSRCTPKLKPEPYRVPIPYDLIDYACAGNPMGIIDEELLHNCGTDEATAAYLLRKCEVEMRKRVPEQYSLNKLFDEFDESMKAYYYNMDTFSNELRSWFAEKSKYTWKMIPRQNKLLSLSNTIQEAELPQQKLNDLHQPLTNIHEVQAAEAEYNNVPMLMQH